MSENQENATENTIQQQVESTNKLTSLNEDNLGLCAVCFVLFNPVILCGALFRTELKNSIVSDIFVFSF